MADGAAGAEFRSNAGKWVLLLVVVAAGVAVVLTPAWIVQPFSAQTFTGLERSYLLRQWSPLVTLVTAAVAVLLALRIWRASNGWWKKSLVAIVVILALGTAWLARQNHFEWMFNPLHGAAFAPAAAASFVEPGDMVLAVERGGDAVAFPVRLMAYHHIVHDVVGGTPIAATY